jgi:uncharacterized membrane protein
MHKLLQLFARTQLIDSNGFSISQAGKKILQSSRIKSGWCLPPKWLRLLIFVVLVLGIFFRFVNLDRKVYWIDETYTSLRISGYTETELVQQLSERQITDIKNLQKYQRINSEHSVIDTIKGLAVEEPQLPPLYFVLARFWAQIWGNSVVAMRSLPSLINLLAFPCIYWLCLELFESPLTGWVAIAVFAVSPFQVLYAQEARPYSLWALTILLSSASLLRAMRLNTWRSWGIYAVTVVVGLYSYLYFALVAIGHGIYVLFNAIWRNRDKFAAFLLASGAGFLTFLPWIGVLIANWSNVANKTNWQQPEVPQPLSVLVRFWISNLSRVFIDFGLLENFPRIFSILLQLTILILIVFLGYTIYFLCRHTYKQVWLFILTLIGTTALALIGTDLISGGMKSTVSRYLVPSYIGFQLAVAFLLATQITATSISAKTQKLWQFVAIALLTVGVISCAISSQAETWYTKYTSYDNPRVAHMINSASQPLLLAQIQADSINFNELGTLISLSYLLEPKVQLELVPKPNVISIPPGFSNIFLIHKPSRTLQTELEQKQNYKIADVYTNSFKDTLLWKLVKQR